ncbi:hypothetical protein FDK21_11755 [Cohaesibacter sp. CAU 1516]|uniref:hypothetical protein n=1 Tax=Cohaesibacter sp. CAU 1516 TaxID=2576038 RepID=UPI0010FD95E6|nr:hypothetical protein [Cohaesibacter sp. CAU 1516]TLP45431.1 hypothetical protein FDK21_11755 [Cohaesibacter sp. CAU 1516]
MLFKPDQPLCYRKRRWQGSVRPGDIVMYRFPLPAFDGEPARPSFPCPCVIHDVTAHSGIHLITLICGTTGLKEQGPNLILVASPQALILAGLTTPTRFDGSIRLTVSSHNQGFEAAANGSPIIGRLAGIERDKFRNMRSRIQAGIDAAAQAQAMRRLRP